MDLLYWWLGYFVFWMAVLVTILLVAIVLIALPWSDWFHWDKWGPWAFGWKLSSRKQFEALKQLWIDHDKNPSWMFRNKFNLPFGFQLYWAHRRNRQMGQLNNYETVETVAASESRN